MAQYFQDSKGRMHEFPDDATMEEIDAATMELEQANEAPITDLPAVRAEATMGDHARAVGRTFGLGGRAIMESVGGTVGIFSDPLTGGMNSLAGTRAHSARDTAGQMADAIGLPRPANGTERVASNITEAVSGGGGIVALGKQIAKRAPGVVQAIGNGFAAMPGTQVASAATGAGAAGVTREGGGSPTQQTVAGLVGGVVPSFGLAALKEGTRRTLRGGEGRLEGVDPRTGARLPEIAGRATMARNIEDFRMLGVEPSVGQATGNRRTQGLESLLAGAPTSGGVMVRAAEKQAEQIGAGLRQKADDFLPNASSTRAGAAITEGIKGENGFKATTRATQGALYDDLDALIDPQTRVGVAKTEQAMPSLNPSIPGAPHLSPLFQNARIRGIEGALGKDTWGAGSVATRPGMAAQVDDVRGAMKSQADEIARVNAENAAAIEAKNATDAAANAAENVRRRSVMLPEIPFTPATHTPYPVTGVKEIDDEIAGMLQGQVDGQLPYEALKKLRTLVGQEIENAGLMSDVPRSKWKELYKALAQDMRVAAEAAGPDAVKAWTRANNYTKYMIKRMDAIAHVVDRKGGPEKIYAAAMAGTAEGGSTLRALMQSLPPEGQRAVTGAVLKRMGLAVKSAQNEAGDVFSAQTFVQNWNGVSKEAKRALFDRHGPKFVADMDRVARVAVRIRDGSKVFANPSGTANKVAAYSYTGSLVAATGAAAFTGTVAPLAVLVVGGLSANIAARVMTNPRFVSALARSTEMPVSALPQFILQLKRQAEITKDPDLMEAAQALENQGQNEAGEGN